MKNDSWVPTLHQAQEYNEIVQHGLTFKTKKDLQNYLDTLYFFEGDKFGENVPEEYTDGVWKIMQGQTKGI